MDAETIEAKGAERRRAPRTRVVLQAHVSYSDNAISTSCTINQLSDVGARITIATSFALPETFDVAIPQRGIVCRARLVWRRDDQAGIDFLPPDAVELMSAAEDSAARIKALEAENVKLKAQIGVLRDQIHRLTEI